MGNNPGHLRYSCGDIVIVTQQPSYYPGSFVTGDVHLFLTQPFEGNRVDILVKGKERCWFRTTETEGEGQDRKTVYVDRYGKNVFYRHRLPLFTFNSPFIQPGQYSFPFSIQIGQILPPTFEFKNNKVEGVVKYKLKCEIMNLRGGSSLNSSIPLIVHPHPLPANKREVMKEIQLRRFCCFPAGKLDFNCTISKDSYSPGEIAAVDIKMNNCVGKIDVEKIDFKLRNEIILTADTGHVYRAAHTVVSTTGNGIEAYNPERQEVIQLKLPSFGTMKPTTNGTKVLSSYSLRVNPHGTGCGCIYSAEIRIPVVINSEIPQNTNYFQHPDPPPNWNPVVMPKQELELSSQYMYPSEKEVAKNITYSQYQNNMKMPMESDKLNNYPEY